MVIFPNCTPRPRVFVSLAVYACLITFVLVQNHLTFAETTGGIKELPTAQKILAEASAMIPNIPNKEIHPKSREVIRQKVSALSRIARLQAKIGDQNGLKQSAERAVQIADGQGYLAYELFSIVSSQIYNGFLEDGKPTLKAGLAAAMSREKKHRDVHLLNFVAPLTTVGDLSKAMKIANSLHSPYDQAHALIKIGYALAEDGKAEEASIIYNQAYQVATSIEKPWNRSACLRLIASAKGEIDNQAEATKLLEEAWQVGTTVEKIERKISTLNLIALEAIRLGNEKRASEMQALVIDHVQGVKNPKTKFDVYLSLGLHQTDSDKPELSFPFIEKAIEIAKNMESPSDKASAFQRISYAYYSPSQRRKAKKFLFMALDNLQIAETKKDRVYSIASIAMEMVRLGSWEPSEVDRVEKVFDQIIAQKQEPFSVPYALSQLATLQATAGKFQKAVNTAHRIQDKQMMKGWAFEGIGKAWARSGKTQAALQWAKGLPSSWYRVRGMIGVADGMVNAERDS